MSIVYIPKVTEIRTHEGGPFLFIECNMKRVWLRETSGKLGVINYKNLTQCSHGEFNNVCQNERTFMLCVSALFCHMRC